MGLPCRWSVGVSVVAVQLCRSNPAYGIQMRGTQGPKSNPPGHHRWKGLYIPRKRGTSLAQRPSLGWQGRL